MLPASSVNTPIDNNRSHLLALRVRLLCELSFNVRQQISLTNLKTDIIGEKAG